LDARRFERIKGRDHDGSGATARDQLAMSSQLWSLYGIKGKIAAEVSGQIGINRR